jgi:phosphoribosylglycinamide formyltransferase 1
LKKRVSFLVSGNGGTLRFFDEAIHRLNSDLEICSVISDRDCGAVSYSQSKKIPSHIVNYNREDVNDLRTTLKNYDPDIIVTNIHKIIDGQTLSLFQNKFINLHYSLLPAFGGLIGMKTVVKAKKLNVQFIGTSCHRVVEAVDAGEIISQSVFNADWNISLEEIYEIVFRSACYCFLNGILLSTDFRPEVQISKADILNTTNYFSPSLIFNPSELGDDIWSKIK